MENWIIPCNVRFFDIEKHFEQCNIVVWKKDSNSIKLGDNVYLYLGAPYSQILYKCVVSNIDVSEDIVEKNSYAIRADAKHKKQKYMELKLIKKYEKDTFSYTVLKENGLGQVQKQARTDRKLQAFISMRDDEE